MMRRTLSCAMLVASVNMLALISCSMQNHAVLWIPLKTKKTGKRQQTLAIHALYISFMEFYNVIINYFLVVFRL